MKNITTALLSVGILFLFSCTKSATTATVEPVTSCSFAATGITRTVTYGAWNSGINACSSYVNGIARWTGMTGNVALVAVPTASFANGDACGTCVSIAGAGATWVGRVIDSCPGCANHEIDMDGTAFEAITGTPQSAGFGTVSVTAIPCPSTENITITMDPAGSNPFYFLMVPSNHATPIKSVEVDVGAGFTAAPRQAGTGGFVLTGVGGPHAGMFPIRITDAFDQIVTGSFDSTVSATTTLSSQFGTCP